MPSAPALRISSAATLRIISAATALIVSTAGVVAAQAPTQPPELRGADLKTAVVTSALDPASVNEAIVETALERHQGLGGKTGGKRGAWTPLDPLPTSDDIVQATIELAQEDYDVIVLSGSDAAATVGIAGSFPVTAFLDIGQPPPCVTLDGQFDPSGLCAGGTAGLPRNYLSVDFAVEDAAYLAGLLAARASRDDRIGIISGASDCESCNRYVRGFVNGARSVEPDIDITLAYLGDDSASGFSDPVSAETFTRAFIDVQQPDVLLPVGRAAASGMIDAACETGEVLVVGAGTDVAAERPELVDCVLTSVVVDMSTAVRDAMNAFANGLLERAVEWDIVNGGVRVDFPQRLTLPTDTFDLYESARTGILTGQIETCPGDCSAPVVLDGTADGSETDEAPAEDE